MNKRIKKDRNSLGQFVKGRIGDRTPKGFKGKNNPFFGRRHTLETRNRMKKNHANFKGKNHPMFGMRGKDNPNFGKHHSKDTIKKQSETLIERGTNKGKNNPMFGRTGKRNFMYGRCGKKHHLFGKKLSKKQRENLKKAWREKRTWWVTQIMKVLKIKPNKPEKAIRKVLNKVLPKEYRYVGNGKVILDGFNPDFINCNGQKKIIEMYGDYWHNRPDWSKRDIRRIRAYKKLGYKTLIIWEHELKDLNKVTSKILRFNKKEK